MMKRFILASSERSARRHAEEEGWPRWHWVFANRRWNVRQAIWEPDDELWACRGFASRANLTIEVAMINLAAIRFCRVDEMLEQMRVFDNCGHGRLIL